MKLQDDKFSCGAVALFNALEAAGQEPPDIPALRKLCGTHPVKGTTTGGVVKALQALSVNHAKVKTKDQFLAFTSLVGCLTGGSSVMLAVDNDSHWVAAVGVLGSRILVADSADGAMIQSLDANHLLARWGCDGYYEGVVIGKRNVE